MNFQPDLNEVYTLTTEDGCLESKHRFEQQHIWAVQAALACRRPLLIRGEPGIGKSQLARAAAFILKRPFLRQTMTADSECKDLLYSFDAVERLAQAQVLSRGGEGDWRAALAPERFIRPAGLWWAFDWESAFNQCLTSYSGDREKAREETPRFPDSWKIGDGAVLLIDEIDKADGDVPNALLEALGGFSFFVPEIGRTIQMKPEATPPLIMITTNEERELPKAFLRRCLVLQMDFSEELLLKRGRDHFENQIFDSVYKEAARQLLEDRTASQASGPAVPGTAEYLDLLTILAECKTEKQQMERLGQVSLFVGAKNQGQHRSRGDSSR